MKIATNENFEKLLEENLSQLSLKPGSVLEATIVKITPDYVVVDAGLKTEDMIPIHEFKGEEINSGDTVEVVVDTVENGFGETRLSREKARRARAWVELEKAHNENTTVEGTIIERVKGGFIVDLDAVFGFLPGSQADVKPVRDPSYLEGKPLPFKIIKMDYRRNNVVVSRRAVLEEGNESERVAKLNELQEGQELMGIVKNITDYGAFIDLGGIDGLLHVTDISWKRIKHPSEVLKVGDEVRVKVLKFDREKNRVSLGIKQLSEDPWQDIIRRYPVDARVSGHITNITDYGCFVELEEGVEGLVHMSEMDWTNKNVHPSKVVKPGQEVEVMVLEIDEERRRISLGIKQCQTNPWKDFADKHEVGQKLTGKIRSITDFGIFLGLSGEIDGLIHLSDLAWTVSGEEAIKEYKKGAEIEAQILAIDSDRERISLGVKQLTDDPMEGFLKEHPENSVIKGKITDVTPKQAKLDLGDNVIGLLRASEFSYERINDLDESLKVGEEVEAKILRVDRKSRAVMLSIKALQAAPASAGNKPKSTKKSKSASTGDSSKVTLGDLLKEQMRKDNDTE